MRRLHRSLFVVPIAFLASSASIHLMADDHLDVEAARAGLAARLVGMSQIGALEPLEDCPTADRDDVVDALTTAGVETPIESLLAEDGPTLTNGTTWEAAGMVCSGVYVGSDGDRSFPELRVSVAVADFGDSDEFAAFIADVHPDLDADVVLPTPTLGGGTIGECASVDLTDRCSEYWEHDGFVVGVRLADRVYMDRPTASAVLVALVPEVVESLAAEPDVAEAAAVTVPSDQLDAARTNLGALGDAEGASECPLLDQPTVDAVLGDAGLEIAVGQWSGVPVELPDGVSAGAACSGRAGSGEVRVSVFDFADSVTAQETIELVHGCERLGTTTYCVETWEQDGLTVSVSVTAVGEEARQPQVRAVVDQLAPQVVANLAAGTG